MGRPVFKLEPSRDYLLVPAKPAANGGLHLGHVGGPYLRLDLVSRHLKRRGDRPRVIFGSDAHDSFVAMRGLEERSPFPAVARRFHARIANDLEAFDIGVDAFIDPCDPEWTDAYTRTHVDVMHRLLRTGDVETVEERLLYSEAASRFVIGCWLLGRCPACGASVSGYFCEACGAHFQPDDVVEPRARAGLGALQERAVKTLFLRLRDVGPLLRQARAGGVADRFVAIVERYVRERGPVVRLTTPDPWGIHWPGSETDGQGSLFGHGLLFAYCLLIGEIYRSDSWTAATPNPFERGSDVTTVNFIGIDNVVSHVFSIQAVAFAVPDFRPFDHFVINEFITLAGAKFSTSARHAIWCSDVVERTPASIDALRYYLTLNDPTEGQSNFEVDRFLRFVEQRFVGELGSWLDVRKTALEGATAATPPAARMDFLEQLLARQADSLRFDSFRPREAAACIDAWLRAESGDRPAGNEAYWSLKGLALLAYPIMPQLSIQLWRSLGGEGEPLLERFHEPSQPRRDVEWKALSPLARSDFDPCLPKALGGGGVPR